PLDELARLAAVLDESCELEQLTEPDHVVPDGDLARRWHQDAPPSSTGGCSVSVGSGSGRAGSGSVVGAGEGGSSVLVAVGVGVDRCGCGRGATVATGCWGITARGGGSAAMLSASTGVLAVTRSPLSVSGPKRAFWTMEAHTWPPRMLTLS